MLSRLSMQEGRAVRYSKFGNLTLNCADQSHWKALCSMWSTAREHMDHRCVSWRRMWHQMVTPRIATRRLRWPASWTSTPGGCHPRQPRWPLQGPLRAPCPPQVPLSNLCSRCDPCRMQLHPEVCLHALVLVRCSSHQILCFKYLCCSSAAQLLEVAVDTPETSFS